MNLKIERPPLHVFVKIIEGMDSVLHPQNEYSNHNVWPKVLLMLFLQTSIFPATAVIYN